MLNKKLLAKVSSAAFLLALVVAMPGCGCEKKPVDSVVEQPNDEDSPYLPFRIAFKTDGTAVIVDEKGNEEKWEPVRFPIENTTLYRVETFSFVFIKGSCWVTAQNVGNSGLTVGKEYPNKLCKKFGIK